MNTTTYHVKLKDGSASMLEMRGWYPAERNVLTHIGVANFRDGRPCVVFFSKMPDGTLVAHLNCGLSSRVVTEVPF